MKQTWNIFEKDVRHHWREITVSLALLAAYAWNDVRGWTGERGLAYGGVAGLISYQILSGLLSVLLPVAWWFLITRVIQGESLVGDKQFWVTRPYEWKKLLAAKVLFIMVTVNLPLLIADFFLLAKAGFPFTHYVAGLLWMQVMISLVVILPIVAVATVTATVVQMILTILGIVLYLILVAGLASLIPSSGFAGPVDSLQFALFLGTCLAVISWQYARRKTAGARWLIAALALVVALIVAATPYDTIVRHEFPALASGEQTPVRLSLLPPDNAAQRGVPGDDNEILILIPLATSGLADDSIVEVSGYRVWIVAPNGSRWHSGWESHGGTFFPDQTSTVISFPLKKSFFERVQSEPVHARIQFALTVYRDRNRREFVTPPGEFLMPDVGFCSARLSYLRELHCRAALRTPSSMLITSDLSATTCPAREEESKAATREIARNWHHNSDSGPAEFGISPVKTLDLFLWPQHDSARRTVSGICPGTPLTISSPEFVRRARTELEFSGLRLADYRVHQLGEGASGFGFSIAR